MERTTTKTGFLRRSKLTPEQLLSEAALCMSSGRPLSKKHLSTWLDVSERYLEKEVERGRLRVIKTSDRFVRFRPADIEKWLERSVVGPAEVAAA